MNPIPFFLVAHAVLVPGGLAESILQPGSIGITKITKIGSGVCLYELELSPAMVGALPLNDVMMWASTFAGIGPLFVQVSSPGPFPVASPITVVRIAVVDAAGLPILEPDFKGTIMFAAMRKGPASA